MEKHPIFKGLAPLSVSAAQDLAVYMKVAGESIGIITSKGHLVTDQFAWARPCAEDNFKVLKEALKENELPWLNVREYQIELDFSKIQYNLAWLKSVIKTCGFGVKNSKEGLVIYTPVQANGSTWYAEQLFWRLKGVTAKDVGAREFKLVALSPDQCDPQCAEWGKLYFA